MRKSTRDSKPASQLRHLLKRLAILVIIAAVVLWLLAHAGSFLVVDSAKKSDIILVLANAGDPDRYLHAVDLLKQGYANRILYDVQMSKVYGMSEDELARQFVEKILPDQTTLCPSHADSTYDEMESAKRCMEPFHPSSVLLVTSEFHTRRASQIFRKRLPQYRLSVGPTWDARWFGLQWWKDRRWAKTTLEEWEKL
ncbi:MAG: YdcF family protein, partial [Acetobacteraceae bacterium]|nr:YdcF family protein [Acetobacteraceae bacterium]